MTVSSFDVEILSSNFPLSVLQMQCFSEMTSTTIIFSLKYLPSLNFESIHRTRSSGWSHASSLASLLRLSADVDFFSDFLSDFLSRLLLRLRLRLLFFFLLLPSFFLSSCFAFSWSCFALYSSFRK